MVCSPVPIVSEGTLWRFLLILDPLDHSGTACLNDKITRRNRSVRSVTGKSVSTGCRQRVSVSPVLPLPDTSPTFPQGNGRNSDFSQSHVHSTPTSASIKSSSSVSGRTAISSSDSCKIVHELLQRGQSQWTLPQVVQAVFFRLTRKHTFLVTRACTFFSPIPIELATRNTNIYIICPTYEPFAR